MQSLKRRPGRPELSCTENVYNSFEGEKLCLPSFYFPAYLTGPAPKSSILFWMEKEKIKDKAKFLENESPENFKNLIDYYLNLGLSGWVERELEDKNKYNYIPGMDIVTDLYKRELMCFNFHHPTPAFYKPLFDRIVQKIECMQDVECSEKDFIYTPGPDGYPNPLKFAYFRKNFPEIKNLTKYEKSYSLNVKDYIKAWESVRAKSQKNKMLTTREVLEGIKILEGKNNSSP